MQRQIRLFLLGLLCSIGTVANAQKPIITSFEPKATTVREKVTINGTGFSNDKSKLVVKIGDIKAPIINSTENSIDIGVPAGINYDQISVTHLSSRLTGYSSDFFMLSFHGRDFVPEKVISRQYETGGPINGTFLDFIVTDLNDDYRPEIVSSNDYGMGIYSSLNNTEENSTDELTLVSKTTSISTATKYFAQGDFNGDGKTDIAVTRGGTPVDRVFIFTNNSTSSSISYNSKVLNLEVAGSNNLQKVSVADIDNDGRPDVIVADNTDDGISSSNNVVHIFRNTSSGGTTSFSSDYYTVKLSDDPNFSNGAQYLDVKDLTGDNLPDVALAPPFGGVVKILQNESVPGIIKLSIKSSFAVAGPLSDVQIADINRDGKNDIVATKQQKSGTNYVHFLMNKSADNGNPDFSTSNVSINKLLDGIEIGDMNGDGNVDVTYSTRDDVPVLGVLINQGNGDYEDFTLGAMSKHFQIRMKDVNADGRPDVLVAQANGKLGIYINRNCVFPDLTPAEDVTLCNGSEYFLNAPRGRYLNYDWFVNGNQVTGNLAAIKATSSGEYTVKVRSDLGTCSEVSAPVKVNFIAGTPPVVTASNDGPACEGGNLQLKASLVSNATYRWTGPNDFTSSQQNPIVNGFDAAKAGKYIVEVKVNGGCTGNKDTTSVEMVSLPSVDVSGPNTICNGQSVNLSVQNYPGHTYYWKFNGNKISGATNPSVTVDQVGTYNVVVSKDGCQKMSDDFEIASYPLPTVAFTADQSICMNDTLTITNSTTVPDQNNPVYYEWYFGTGNPVKDKNPVFAYKVSGDFTIKLKVGYENSTCYSEATQPISVVGADPLSITAPVTQFCKGDSVLLTASGDFENYNWSTGDVGKEVYVTEQGEVSVSALNPTGCKSVANKLLTWKPIPLPIEIITEPADTILAFGDTRKLLPQNVSYTIYNWTPDIYLDDPTYKEPTAKPFKTTTYTLKAKDEGKCWAFGEITLIVDGEGPQLAADKLFSPNGDGMNDLWVIKDIEQYKNQIAVFNRQGEKVYEVTDYFNDWDGRSSAGRDLPEGVYYWVIKYQETNTSQGGSVLITR